MACIYSRVACVLCRAESTGNQPTSSLQFPATAEVARPDQPTAPLNSEPSPNTQAALVDDVALATMTDTDDMPALPREEPPPWKEHIPGMRQRQWPVRDQNSKAQDQNSGAQNQNVNNKDFRAAEKPDEQGAGKDEDGKAMSRLCSPVFEFVGGGGLCLNPRVSVQRLRGVGKRPGPGRFPTPRKRWTLTRGFKHKPPPPTNSNTGDY